MKIPFKIYVNNRKLINEVMIDENIEERYREQAIREIDKLDKLSKVEVADNLKKINAEKLLKVFDQKEKNFEKYNFYKEIKELKDFCKSYGVGVEFRPFLARGLSYYNGTVFEIWSEKLNVSLAGGGEYLIDGVQSCGIALGFEPISLISKIEGDNTQYEIVSIGKDFEAIKLAEKFRTEGKSVVLIMDKSPGKAIEYANMKNIEKIIFIGKKEVENKKFKIRDMKSGEEEEVIMENI